MTLVDRKITDTQISANGVASAPDRLTGTAAQNKAIFDNLIKTIVKTELNAVIDDLIATADGASGADQIGATAISGLSGATVQALLEALKGLADTTTSNVTTAQSDIDTHEANLSNPHSVTKSQVSLGNADNTSDANKPVSTAAQTALDLKVDKVTGKGLSTNDYDATEKSNVAANTSARHSHSNKTILDNITAAYTTIEQTKLSNQSGTNTGDQDLSDYALRLPVEKRLSSIETQTAALTQANPASDATVTASTRSIASLPKNAADWYMPTVNVDGLTVKNLIINGGNFVNTTGWTASGNNTLSIVNGRLRNTLGSTNYMYASQTISFIAGRKYYFRVNGYIGNSSWRFGVYSSSNSPLINNTNQTSDGIYSTIYTALADDAVTVRLITDTITDGAYAEFGIVNSIDLTDLGLETKTVAELDEMFPAYIEGTQGVTATRVKSVSEDETQSTSLYLPNETLRRVPNGVADTIEQQADGTFSKVQRVSGEYALQASDINSISSGDTTQRIRFKKQTDFIYYNLSGIPVATIVSAAYMPDYPSALVADIVNTFTGWSSTEWVLYVPLGTYADLAAAQAALAGTKIIYQLAAPITTPVQTFGQLISKPSGTIYVDNVLGDIGYYSSGITVTGVTFDAIEEVHKIDATTGAETDVTSTCTLTADGFTSTALSNGDLVWYALHIKDKPKGLVTYNYYDNRFVVADTANSKIYKWAITSTNGVASVALTEV